MKTHLLIILVFISDLAFVSCTSNHGSNPLIGTWTLTSEQVTDCDDSRDIYQTTIPCSDSICFRITFVRDGKMKVDVTMEGATNSWNETYTINNNIISICGPNGCRDQGTFTINDSLLILADSSASERGCLKKEYYTRLAAD